MKPDAVPKPPPLTFPKLESLRDLLPIYPPSEPLDRPELPSPPRKPAFDAPYTLSTHIVPAAYLRTTWPAPVPPPPPPNASKEERKRIVAETYQTLLDLRKSRGSEGHPRILWNCVNRYVKKGLSKENRTGVTLFLAHANGFLKEIWEPILSYLLSSKAGVLIDEVWSWECVAHGDSALLNAASAVGAIDWNDTARDMINFFINFLPSGATDEPLPTHLPRLSSAESETRLKDGFSQRKLVVIGHSYGGATLSLGATVFPALFTSVILIDPIIVEPYEKEQRSKAVHLAIGAISRREQWDSREEALTSFLKSPFFRTWDPAVLALYVECGLYLTSSTPPTARLKMPAIQEAAAFSDVTTSAEIFQRTCGLDKRIPLRWIIPGKPGSTFIGGRDATERRVWLRPENSSNTKILGAGHLIPQEAPKELALDLEEYLLSSFPHLQSSPLQSKL